MADMEAARGAGVLAAFAAAAIVWTTLLLPAKPPPPLGKYAGVYYNPCCGSFTITKDRISIDRLSSAASTGWDKKGIYILPERYFGVEGGRRTAFGSGFPLKMYVKQATKTLVVEVWDVDSGTTYRFCTLTVKPCPLPTNVGGLRPRDIRGP